MPCPSVGLRLQAMVHMHCPQRHIELPAQSRHGMQKHMGIQAAAVGNQVSRRAGKGLQVLLQVGGTETHGALGLVSC